MGILPSILLHAASRRRERSESAGTASCIVVILRLFRVDRFARLKPRAIEQLVGGFKPFRAPSRHRESALGHADGQMNRAFLLATLSMVACSKPSTTESQPANAPIPAPERKTNAAPAVAQREPSREAVAWFAERCVVCHGLDGAGHGAAAPELDIKLHDWRDATWQARVTDRELAEIIVRGGEAIGKSRTMPAHPQLADSPVVVDDLVAIIRACRSRP